MKKVQVVEVFTPTKPARIAFIERDKINDRLVSALRMPGKQIIVYGHSGSGKTTLLINKLEQLYENHVTTRCMKGIKFDQLILDAFDQLKPYFTSEQVASLTKSISTDIEGNYLFIHSKINCLVTSESTKKDQRILPPQLTPQALGKFLGQAKCCWVLEDFHKIDESEKVQLSQLMKVFMDLSDEFEDLKIIALGAVDSARQVVEYDEEMRNRVAEIHVELMTVKEIESIISKAEEALNISFKGELKTSIATYSNGLASVCHHLCMYMCDAADISETLEQKRLLTKVELEQALKLYIDESSDSITSAFDRAVKSRRKTKFENGKLILEVLSTCKGRGASRTDLLKKIRKKEPKYPEANLKYLLPKLETEEYGGLVRYDSTAGLYSFADPINQVFALAYFRNSTSQTTQNFSELKGLMELFERIQKSINT